MIYNFSTYMNLYQDKLYIRIVALNDKLQLFVVAKFFLPLFRVFKFMDFEILNFKF
jgi:hypothetical protein